MEALPVLVFQTTPQNLGKITSESTFDHSKVVFRPFYAQKEFLRKILSLPDFEIRDSDGTQTVILENNIRPSSTFFVSGGYLRTVVLYFFWVSVEEEVRHHLITRYIYCWNRTLQLKEDPSHDICVRCHINLWGQRTPNRASSAARHRSSRQHPPIPFPLTQPSPIRWWAWEGYWGSWRVWGGKLLQQWK